MISGIINFLLGSIRQAEELSITTVPCSANLGAHSIEVSPPAENNAISGLMETALDSPTTLKLLSLKSIFLPTDRAEATGINSVIGKLRSESTCNITSPTIPVAPTIASFISKFL